jgi:hypothetical protein
MSPVETKLVDVVLRKIRSKKQETAERTSHVATSSPAAGPVSVQQAQFSDFDRVCAMNVELGQGPDSRGNWNRLWRDNPAVTNANGASCIGWTLEASGELVGFLGSIPLLYEFEGRTLNAAATCRLAVRPAYRGFTHLLIASYFRQKNVDLFLNTTATVSAGKMMLALKATPLPQPEYETVLFWVLDARHFTKAVLQKMGVHPSLIRAGGAVASLGLRGDIAVRGRTPKSKSGRFTLLEHSIAEIGEDFARFWSDNSAETAPLMAKRTPAIMRWHFEPPMSERRSVVISCYSGTVLRGYAIVLHDPTSKDGIKRSAIADLMVKGRDAEIVGQLLSAAHKCAKNAGSHSLEVMGFPRGIRQILMRWKPYWRKYPACPFYFKARDRALQERLADENAWYACPFDGDSTIWP